jgi:hypothetical protein
MAQDRVINKITEKNKTTFFFFINATPTKYSMIDNTKNAKYDSNNNVIILLILINNRLPYFKTSLIFYALILLSNIISPILAIILSCARVKTK